jgi:hypothetical protein
MKKYYAISPMNEVSYVGEFQEFRDCWDYVEYESDIRYVWIISERSMKKLQSTFKNILENQE